MGSSGDYSSWVELALTDTETETRPTRTPTKPMEGDDLDERIKRIIREIPGPTPQPGGE